MNHPKQHGGWAQAAKRRGEDYIGCNQCGNHPRPYATPSTDDMDAAGVIGFAAVMILFYTAFIWMLLLVQP